MKKIAIAGISASGKSTISRTIAEKTGLPLFHMDQLFWKGNWEEIPEAEYLKTHAELIKKDEWIIEGYVDEKMSDRLKAADIVLYLDYSGVRCALQLVKRWVQHRKKSRPELHEDAQEKFSWSFLWLVLTRGERPRIEGALAESGATHVKRFKSPNELNTFLSTLR